MGAAHPDPAADRHAPLCLGLGVVAVIAGAAALVSGMGWLAALSGAVLAGCILIGRHEMARTLPPDPDDPPEDHSSIFSSMDNLTSGP